MAAYKAPDIARRLKSAGAEVTAVCTDGALRFITALTLTAVTGKAALTDPFDLGHGRMPHLDLAKSTDAVLIAPASANCLARLAAGMANDLLTSLCLVTRAPIFVAPAMHEPMWTHPATQRNAKILAEFGHQFLGPVSGSLASGDEGQGRMMDPADIVESLARLLPHK